MLRRNKLNAAVIIFIIQMECQCHRFSRLHLSDPENMSVLIGIGFLLFPPDNFRLRAMSRLKINIQFLRLFRRIHIGYGSFNALFPGVGPVGPTVRRQLTALRRRLRQSKIAIRTDFFTRGRQYQLVDNFKRIGLFIIPLKDIFRNHKAKAKGAVILIQITILRLRNPVEGSYSLFFMFAD